MKVPPLNVLYDNPTVRVSSVRIPSVCKCPRKGPCVRFPLVKVSYRWLPYIEVLFWQSPLFLQIFLSLNPNPFMRVKVSPAIPAAKKNLTGEILPAKVCNQKPSHQSSGVEHPLCEKSECENP